MSGSPWIRSRYILFECQTGHAGPDNDELLADGELLACHHSNLQLLHGWPMHMPYSKLGFVKLDRCSSAIERLTIV
jgi:hypothetical protein